MDFPPVGPWKEKREGSVRFESKEDEISPVFWMKVERWGVCAFVFVSPVIPGSLALKSPRIIGVPVVENCLKLDSSVLSMVLHSEVLFGGM